MVARSSRVRLRKLEILLILAAGVLLLQLVPSLPSFIRLLDFRNWSRLTWFVLNVAIVGVLCWVRFARARGAPRRPKRQSRKSSAEDFEKKQKLKEHRELLKRLQDGRKRRIY
jgi:type VI protein secretion system component VasK